MPVRISRAPAALVLLAVLFAASPAVHAAEPDIAALAQRATLAADINEVKRLQRIYGYYIDRSDWDNVVDLLTDDATAEYGSSGVYVGKAKIRELLYGIGYGKRGLQPQQLREHIQLQPVVHVAGDGRTAQGRWTALVLLGQFKAYGRWQLGPYENEYRKEGGKWKISKLRWSETFTVPYETGWKGSMTASNVADRKLPSPDRPATQPGASWPSVKLLPYHYATPAAAAARITGAIPAPAGARNMDVAELSRQVERLEDERAIEILQSSYGYYVDKNLWEHVADLFAEDATLEIGGRGVFVGRKRILQYMQYLGNPAPGRLYDHTQMQPVIHVAADGSAAKARWRALIAVGEPPATAMLGDAIYENEYKKEGGKWKIAKLHAWFMFYTNVDEGWGKSALANTRPEKNLPPDRPPTLVYDMYPGTLTGPYHYENPLTGKPVFDVTARATNARGDATQLADLARRIASLEDTQSVENVQNAYAHYIDKWQWAEAAQLFAADGTYEDALRGVYKGRERVRQALQLGGPQGLANGQHQGEVNARIQYQHVIHVTPDGRDASARVRELQLLGKHGGDAFLGAGVEENRYVKEAAGWRIRSLHVFQTYLVKYGTKWGEGALPAPGPSTKLPPDAPPTNSYSSFPQFYVPAFHYDNPASGRAAPK